MRRAFVLLAMIVALVAVGCGGDDDAGGGASKDDYAQQVAAAGAAAQKSLSGIADRTGSETDYKAIAARLEAGTKALDDTATKLKDIDPPADAKGAHQKLIDGIDEISAVFQKCADAARRNDAKAFATALKSLASNPGVAKLAEAQKELEAKGITIPDTTS